MTQSDELSECEWCGANFERSSTKGPPPKYCCRSHRQRAYEAKRFVDVASVSKSIFDRSKLDFASISKAVADASKLDFASISKAVADATKPNFAPISQALTDASKLDAAFNSKTVFDASELSFACTSNAQSEISKRDLASIGKAVFDTSEVDFASISEAVFDASQLDFASISEAVFDASQLDFASIRGAVFDTSELDFASISEAVFDASQLDFASISIAAADLLRLSNNPAFGGVDSIDFTRIAESVSLPIMKSFDEMTFTAIDLDRLSRTFRSDQFDHTGFAESLGPLAEWSDVGAMGPNQIARTVLDDLRSSSQIGSAVQMISDAIEQEIGESGVDHNNSDILVLGIVGAFLWALVSVYVTSPAEQAKMAVFLAVIGWKILESHTFNVLVTVGTAALALNDLSRRRSRTDHSSPSSEDN